MSGTTAQLLFFVVVVVDVSHIQRISMRRGLVGYRFVYGRVGEERGTRVRQPHLPAKKVLRETEEADKEDLRNLW